MVTFSTRPFSPFIEFLSHRSRQKSDRSKHASQHIDAFESNKNQQRISSCAVPCSYLCFRSLRCSIMVCSVPKTFFTRSAGFGNWSVRLLCVQSYSALPSSKTSIWSPLHCITALVCLCGFGFVLGLFTNARKVIIDTDSLAALLNKHLVQAIEPKAEHNGRRNQMVIMIFDDLDWDEVALVPDASEGCFAIGPDQGLCS